MRRLALALASTAFVAAASPASATHGGVHPTFRTETTYFHCTGTTKVSNVNNAAADSTPTAWNTTPPAQSVQQGAGCGAIDVGAVRSTGQVDAIFAGTFTGNLRDLTIRLHNLVLSRVRAGTTLGVKVNRLDVDGQRVVDNQVVAVTPVLSSTGASEYYELSVTGLGSATEVKDAQGNVVDVITKGFAKEDGDGTTPHEISLMIDTDGNEANSIWVWDTTEVPSGLVFNPASLAAARIPATVS